jgi:hypothetical protein
MLDGGQIKGQAGADPIEHHADSGAMAFAKSDYPQRSAKCVWGDVQHRIKIIQAEPLAKL